MNWALISTHGLVLLYISRNSRCTKLEIANALGITERTVHRIIKDLEQAGFLSWDSAGKSNIYSINYKSKMAHDLTSTVTVNRLLKALNSLA